MKNVRIDIDSLATKYYCWSFVDCPTVENFGFTSYVPLDVWVNGGSDERQALAFFDPNVNLPTVQSGLLPGHSFKKKKKKKEATKIKTHLQYNGLD